MTIPPIDFDRLFNRTPSLEPKDQVISDPPIDIDFDRLLGRKPGPADTAEKLLAAMTPDQLPQTTDPFVQEYDASVFSGRRRPTAAPDVASMALQGVQTARDATAQMYVPGIGRPGEGRADRLMREQAEYFSSGRAKQDMLNAPTGEVSEAPTGLAKFKQTVANMRLFTDRSIVEFDQGNSSGFHVGIPFARPIETAKQLVVGLPHFFADLVRQPFYLAVDKLEPGSGYLLPEERHRYRREVIANYAGLMVAFSAGRVFHAMRVGREFLKTGVGAMERAGIQAPVGELELIAGTARAAARELTIPGQIRTGIVEGLAGGVTTGTLMGETKEESRNLAATYALMAVPAGVAFEAIAGRIRGARPDIHFATAIHAHELSVIRQMQDAAGQSEQNARNSFLALRNSSDLAEAARRANVNRPVVVQGVDTYKPDGTEIVHRRPDGKLDIAFGGVPEIEAPPSRIPEQFKLLTDEMLGVVIAANEARLTLAQDPRDQAELKELLDVLYEERRERTPASPTPEEVQEVSLSIARKNDPRLERSKVKDPDGNPIKVYRGAAEGHQGFAAGFFSEDPQHASFFTTEKGRFAAGRDVTLEGGNVTPAYLNVENPLDLTQPMSLKAAKDLVDEVIITDSRAASDREYAEVLRDVMKGRAGKYVPWIEEVWKDYAIRHGYDGIKFVDPAPIKTKRVSWYVFDDAQVISPYDDIISRAKTGDNTVGAKTNQELLYQNIAAGMYKNEHSITVVKEAIQNAVDAVRPLGQGKVTVEMSAYEGKFTFIDTGHGMTPEVAADQFMDPGESFKVGLSSGGLGMAKVALFMKAEAIYMETVAETPEGKKRTIIRGNGKMWLDGKLDYQVSDVPDNTPTGTMLKLQYDKKSTERDAGPARSWLEKYIKYSRKEVTGVEVEVTGYGAPKQLPKKLLDTVETDGAKLEMLASENMEEYGDGGYIHYYVLNRGIFQFAGYDKIRGVAPEFLVVDVHAKVDVKDENYPFTTSRESVKPAIENEIKKYIAVLGIKAARDEAYSYINTLREAPEIPGSNGLRLMDTGTKKIAEPVFKRILNSPVTRYFADLLYDVFPPVALAMESRRVQIGGHRTFLNYTLGGIGLGESYLGLNISSSSLNEVAKAANIPDTGIKNNVILINPFIIFREIIAAESVDPGQVPLHHQLAEHTIGTIVHELLHEQARDHDKHFSQVITRTVGVILRENPQVLIDIQDAWEGILNHTDEKGDPTFNNLYMDLQLEWERQGDNDNKLKSISTDFAPPRRDEGDALGGDAGGEQLPTPGGSAPVSGGAGTRPSPVVPGSAQLGAAEGSGAAGEPPGTFERRRREAITSFELGGYFPNEIVSFLGNEYTYVQPIIGKDGNLEAHVIRDADGKKVEVPWNAIRHGPDMAVNTFLFDKPAARKALVDNFEAFLTQQGQRLASKPFAEQVAEYVANKNYNKAMIAPFISFLSNEYGRRLRDASLVTEEKLAYEKLVREVRKYRENSAANLVELATTNGMYIERQNGALIIRDAETGAYLELAHSPEEAISFIQNVVEDRAADLTPGGLPPGVARGLIPPPPPPNGPHGSAWNPRYNGWFGDLRDAFNVSAIGTRFTGMRQIMISLDNQLKTEFFGKVYYPLQVDHQRKYAAMHADMTRVAETARIARNLPVERLEQVTTSIETMHPDDLIKAGGLFNRPFTPRELAGAKWFIDNGIDIRKAFLYYRGLKTLEGKRRFQTLDEGKKVEAVRKLQASLAVDEGTIEAARIIGRVISINKPGELSIYGIVRLAEAVMDGHVSPDEYIRRYFPAETTEEGRKMRLLREEVISHFRDLADSFDIPDEQRLGGYFAHLRNYANDEIIAGRDGAPIFTSELLRTGEMNEYDRDPINVLVRYINAGFSNRFTKQSIDDAFEYINKETARMTDPAHGEYVRKLLIENYVNELRGIPHASTSFAEKILNGVLDRIGYKSADVSVRRDVVNTFLSLSSSAAIGFRPMQGIRDFHNFTSIYFSRFGAERLTSLFTIMAKVTPDDLVRAKIIKGTRPEEGAGAALAREGIIPTLAPVSVLSAQERLQNSISARISPYREFIQNTADAGIKWGLQHNVYQWAHAAAYLETSIRVGEELTKLATGEYGFGDAAKQKAYDALFLNSYDPPVAQHFDRLVTEGKFKDAADFLGRATSFETVSTFGLANHPAGWGTNTGRLFGQFGNWPVWARTTLARLLTRGTTQERTRVAVRFGMTQGALAAASAALGLNLNSWYLPGAAPAVSAFQHFGTAIQSYDDEQTEEFQRAAAAVVLGVPGSMMFRGGPAFSAIATGVAAGQAYPQAEREAAAALTRLPMLGIPGSYLLRDIYEASQMAENGDNPVSVWLRALGIPSTPDESLLNPAGIVTE